MKAKIILSLFMVATLGLIVFLYHHPEDPNDSSQLTAIGASMGEGSQAPDFILNDPAGRPVGLKEYRGKVVLLGFWTTW
jgi:cytochrome oxidase Cu insertion factor (SCO1/SenC/PrrC family)